MSTGLAKNDIPTKFKILIIKNNETANELNIASCILRKKSIRQEKEWCYNIKLKKGSIDPNIPL